MEQTVIEATEILGGDVSADGSSGWIDLKSAGGPVRLTMSHSTLTTLPYVILPLVTKAEARANGPGVYQVYRPDRVDAAVDVKDPSILMIQIELGRGAILVFELPRGDADRLVDEILSLRPKASAVPPANLH
jgi:hypothetical protein